MAGHSKWKQIKRAKAITDSKRASVFTKLGREITVAARVGGGDPDGNARLRLALLKAREANMPGDIIERAIAKAAGDSETSQLDEVVYEGFAPGGTSVMVEALTDNRNRTVAEIRVAFSRGGGNLGESGSVAWMFTSRGVIAVGNDGKRDPDEIVLTAIDAGADDVAIEDDGVSIFTKPEDLDLVRRAILEAGIEAESAELSRVPNATVTLEEQEAILALKLLDRLEDLDDVQRVFSNADFPDEVLASYSA